MGTFSNRVGILYFLFFRSEGNLLQLISLPDTSQEATLPGRFEIWSKALLILRDFPLTGIGLGAFGEVYQQYFASIVLPSSADVVYHAHNTMLSVAVEVGIPGLLAYSILIGGFGAMSWKMLTCTDVLKVSIVGWNAVGFVFLFTVFFTVIHNIRWLTVLKVLLPELPNKRLDFLQFYQWLMNSYTVGLFISH